MVTRMRRWRRRLGDSDAGVTLLELSVAMLITSIIAATMLTWVIGVVTTDDRHNSTDFVLGDLRDVGDRLTRELRAAEYLTVAEPNRLTFWADFDRDNVVDTGEMVTWRLTDDGVMLRSVDGGASTAIATHLVAGTEFSYDSSTPANVEQVTLDLVGVVMSGAQEDELVYTTDIYLRNSNTPGLTTSTAPGSTTTSPGSTSTVPGSTTTTTPGSTTTTAGQPLVVYKVNMSIDTRKNKATATVTVKDQYGKKPAGVTVHIRWSMSPSQSGYPTTATAVTNSSGVATLTQTMSPPKDTMVTLCVTNLVRTGYSYSGGEICTSKKW